MKHDVGDKVAIKGKEWFEKNKELIEFNSEIRASVKHFLHLCDPYFGKEAMIAEKVIEYNGYKLDIDNGRFVWPEEFFE